MRKWDADGNAEDHEDVVLDYSAGPGSAGSDNDTEDTSRAKLDEIDQSTWGSKTTQGEFVLKDLDREVQEILRKADEKEDNSTKTTKGGVVGGISSVGIGALGYFKNFVGGKVLTKEDTEKAMAGVMNHLLEKNVAREAAVQLCDSVQASLVGQKTGSFQSKYLFARITMNKNSLY